MTDLNISPLQTKYLKALFDSEHTEIFIGGSAGCFTAETLVKTNRGYIPIAKIKKDDIVLSYNEKSQINEWKPVLDTFIYKVAHPHTRVKLKSGVEINATQNHKFLCDGQWVTIRELCERSLEGNKELKWSLFNKFFRKIKNNFLEKFKTNSYNESGSKRKRLPSRNNCSKRKKSQSKFAQVSCNLFYSKHFKQTPSESQKLQHKRQSSRESRMGHSKRKLRPFDVSWKATQFYKECRKNFKFERLFKFKRFSGGDQQINRARSKRDSEKVHSWCVRAKASCKRVRSKTFDHKRCNSPSQLETCCLKPDDIESFKFFESEVKVYDICVQDNHNYVVTTDDLIVHNSQKSFTGCLWILICALKYPNTRYFLARARLKSLKESTLLTFFEVCRMCNLEPDKHYSYNAVTGVVKILINGSEVYLRDLFAYPSDPDFVSLGSTEYTAGFIDEMGEITPQAYNIIRSRIRYKLDEYNLIPKLLMGSNPCKTFVYNEFYQKFKQDKLEPYKKVILGTVRDNPFISEHYIKNLEKLDPINKARLLDGDWEYDDDPSKLLEYEEILDLWNNAHVKPEGNKYLTVDVARFGRDKTVLCYWHGLILKKMYAYDKTSITEVVALVKDICHKHEIATRYVVVDEDGIGGGVVDALSTCRGFVNNSKAFPDETGTSNYANLKTQCYFKLVELIKANKIYIEDDNTQFKEYLVQELEQLKRKDIDKDQKVRIIDKEKIKENIGRSPDFSDAVMLRMFDIVQEIEAFTLDDDEGLVF